MKKYLILILLLSFLLMSCNTTFDGYSYSVEDARRNESFYDEYDYMFTVKQEDKVVDFLIHEDYLHILKLDCKGRNGKMLYQIGDRTTFLISESKDADTWSQTGNFLFQVKYHIVKKDESVSQEGFEFLYDDIEYVLLYYIVE